MKFVLKACLTVAALICLTSCFFGPSLLFYDRDIIGKPNLISNPDFEMPLLPDKKLPKDWTFLSNADFQNIISWDSLSVQNGDKSIKIDGPTQQILIVSEAFPVDNRSAYVNRCYVRSKVPSATPVTLYFRTFDKIGNRKDSYMNKLKTITYWQEILLSTGFFHPSVQFARVIISIPIDPENTYWVDNIGSYHVHAFSR